MPGPCWVGDRQTRSHLRGPAPWDCKPATPQQLLQLDEPREAISRPATSKSNRQPPEARSLGVHGVWRLHTSFIEIRTFSMPEPDLPSHPTLHFLSRVLMGRGGHVGFRG